MNIPNPKQLGVPHPRWRPSQKDLYIKAKTIADSEDGGNLVAEAPTGLGKSTIPTALGADHKVTVLVQNHGLLEQYEREYGFDIVKGKQEYPCVLKTKVDHWKKAYGITPTAADCTMSEDDYCPQEYSCPYILARNKALSSRRMACTYKYASLSKSVRERTGIVVMDEAHNIYEELLSISQLVVTQEEARKLGMPKFPLINFGPGQNGDVLEGENKTKVAVWVMTSMSIVANVDLFDQLTPIGTHKTNMFMRLTNCLKLLSGDSPIFYRCTTDGRKNNLVLQIKSIDVKETFSNLQENKHMTLFMSATLGNPDALMKIIGVDKYSFHTYSHPVPKQKRPVYDLQFEKMTKANLDSRPILYRKQADAIVDFIETLDKNWRGIILTTSNYKIDLLKRFVRERMNGRVFDSNSNGVSARIADFIADKRPGMVAIDTIQGWGSGISLVGNVARYSIVAGVPYANPGDRFDQLRMSSDEGKRYAFWNAYCAVAQATGRVSRGELEEDGNYSLNVAALADGSTTTAQAIGSYPKWFSEAIVKFRK